MVWHVDKYKITFKLVISHWTNEMSFSTNSRILFSSEHFHYKIFIHEKMLRKLKWQLPGEPLAARYNWCQGPVPGRGPAVEKQWLKALRSVYIHDQLLTVKDSFRPHAPLKHSILFLQQPLFTYTVSTDTFSNRFISTTRSTETFHIIFTTATIYLHCINWYVFK